MHGQVRRGVPSRYGCEAATGTKVNPQHPSVRTKLALTSHNILNGQLKK